MLNFDFISRAAYHTDLMMVTNYTSQKPLPDDYERFQCFRFDSHVLKNVPLPKIPGLEIYSSFTISGLCILDKWICVSIGSMGEARILILDRETKQLIATLLDPDLKDSPRQDGKYCGYISIQVSGNTLAAVSERGRVAIWQNFITNQSKPIRVWDAGFGETILFSPDSQVTIISNRWHQSVNTFKIGCAKVCEWERSSSDRRYRWISQDCLLKAEGYRPDNISPRHSSYIPYIDIFWIGQTKPFIGIKPLEKTVVDIGEFYTAIIDLDCVTLIGSDGLVQLSFGAGNKSKRRECSNDVRTDTLVKGFHPGRSHMLWIQAHGRKATRLARQTE